MEVVNMTQHSGGIYAEPANPALPKADFKFDVARAALVVVDPQIDFLSPQGVSWGVFGPSITENNTVANVGRLFKGAKEAEIPVTISPPYYYPSDPVWKFAGPLEHHI